MSFRVREAAAADAPGIRRIFARAFAREMSADEWEWKYPGNPDGWFAVVAEAGGEIVGHYGAWPMRAILGGKERTIVSLGDVVTEKAVRALGGRRNPFRAMAEAMFAMLRERRIPFGFGFPSPRALLVGERLLGYRAHFPIREIAYPVPARARRPPGAVVSESVDESYDPLWDAARARLRTGLVRDRRRLNWRYHARPDRYYRFVTVRGANGGGALGVLSVVGETAFVVDAVVTGSSDSGLLLEALEGEAAAMGARQVVFWETPGGALAELARRGRAGETAPTVRDAGFSFVTAVVHEEDAIVEFVTHGQISAGIYDDR